MGMMKEFKTFAMRGNVVDMAVGVVIGAAFGKIVSSLVSGVILPPIGKLLGNVKFGGLKVVIQQAAGETPEVAILYGAFLMTIIDFIIIAFVIFMALKGLNAAKRKEEAAPAAAPTTKDCPRCLSSVPLKATRCGHCTSDLA